jgi:hypothetical protein
MDRRARSLVAEHRSPVVLDRGIGVHRLHRGHDAEACEPPHVGVGHRLEVLDAVAPVALAVELGGVLQGVEREVGRRVADRVHGDLQAGGVGGRDHRRRRREVPHRPGGGCRLRTAPSLRPFGCR